ncbi:cell division protein FtsZ [Sphingomonas sp. So64.6b]|uniref:cell division protein FtsZ n=1 Tax=Sphingomonas sp. So64.6b TaxID=2997354 RepID=UPI0016044D49|nr:cell division protein FtsZ [Sphingomonas sp. So64.6b]QNA83123.1 cell division protein FtsZ [Sphingomonas sp. So64.6b]
MSIEFLPPEVDELTPRIAVIGVGGAGGNAIANMMRADVQGVDFLVANTDAQALKQSDAPHRIQLGAKITQGLGAGSRPEIGRAAAEETIDQLTKTLEGAHMCFIAAGMGGGTGTGAAPVIAKAARDMGILTVGVVTKPFAFEGSRRAKAAEAGIEELQKYVDTLIVIPNQNLFLVANANTTFKEAFQMADEVLQQGVRGITDLMVMPGLINLDFADVRSVMQEMGKAMMGTGEASGDNRAIEAASKAIANPLLDGVSMKGAKGVIVSITGGDDMRLLEVDEAANHIRELVDEDANIIWGSAFNPDLEGKIRVSVVATGIEATARPIEAAAPASRAFTFSAPKKAEEPVAETLETYGSATTDGEAVAEPAEVDAFAAEPVEASDSDELILGSETEVPATDGEEAQPIKVFGDDVPADAAPAKDVGAASDGGARRRWLSPGTPVADEETAAETPAAPAAPRVKLGGTLFERMSGASRGAAREEEPADKDPLDIPRFLHRQNNQ